MELCYDARVVGGSGLDCPHHEMKLNSFSDGRKNMTQAATRLGLALALVFLSVFTTGATGSGEDTISPKILAFYYHADW